MDANALSDVQCGKRTAKACGPGALVAGANPRVEEPGGTVTQKPVSPGRARSSLLRPLRREFRCFGFICGDYLCAFYQCTQGCGCSQTPGIPCALLEAPCRSKLGRL